MGDGNSVLCKEASLLHSQELTSISNYRLTHKHAAAAIKAKYQWLICSMALLSL